MNDSRTLHVALGLTALAMVYGVFQARAFLTGPLLTVDSPVAYTTLSTGALLVTGTAHNVSKVTLNGEPIYTDEHGTFKERLLVPNGYAIIEVAAENRFGRRTEKRLPFFGVPPARAAVTPEAPTIASEVSEGTDT